MPVRTRKEDLKTVAVVAAALLLFGWFTGRRAALYAGPALLLCCLLSPRLSARAAAAWLGFAEALGKLNTRLLLTAVFFLVLTPVAFLRRIVSGETLDTPRKSEGSYFRERGGKFTGEDMEKLW